MRALVDFQVWGMDLHWLVTASITVTSKWPETMKNPPAASETAGRACVQSSLLGPQDTDAQSRRDHHVPLTASKASRLREIKAATTSTKNKNDTSFHGKLVI